MPVAEPQVNRRRRKAPATETAAPEAPLAQTEFVEDVRDPGPDPTADTADTAATSAADRAAQTSADGAPRSAKPKTTAPPAGAKSNDAHGVAREQLRSFIERIENLEEEKKTIADDIKDVYGEAKGTGFDTKILRKVVAIRKQDADERAEQEAILDTYLHALGMQAAPAEDYD